MKAGADLKQGSDAPIQIDFSRRRLRDAREDLKQRRFAGAVAADDADHLARRHLEIDVLESPKLLVAVTAAISKGVERRLDGFDNRFAKGRITLGGAADRVLLA